MPTVLIAYQVGRLRQAVQVVLRENHRNVLLVPLPARVPEQQTFKARHRLRGTGWPYMATTTVRSRLFSDHTPMAVFAQSLMIAIAPGS